jgi:hypothetical protein
MVSWPVWADRLTWLGVTPDWEKRHKDRHTEKLGTRWAQHSWWEMPVTPSAYKCIYLYSRCGKAEWKAGRVLMGPVTRQQEQHSCGMLLFTADYPDFVNMPCFPCKAALLSLASPWLGPCLSAKGPFDRAVLMPRSISTASVSLLARQPCWTLLTSFVPGALPSQHKGLSHGLAHVKVLSQSI